MALEKVPLWKVGVSVFGRLGVAPLGFRVWGLEFVWGLGFRVLGFRVCHGRPDFSVSVSAAWDAKCWRKVARFGPKATSPATHSILTL